MMLCLTARHTWFARTKHVRFKQDELEDLNALKRSPDLLYDVKIGQGQIRLIIETNVALLYMGNLAILVK